MQITRRLASTLARTGPTCAPVPNRSLISLTGPHASQFLNGVLTTSLAETPSGGFFSSFLHAQGRVLYDVFVYPQPDGNGFLIDYDPRPAEGTPPLPSLLKRYILRSKVKVQDLGSQYDVWSVWGSELERETGERKWRWARSGAVEPIISTERPSDGFSLTDRRAVGMGKRVLVRKGDRPKDSQNHDVAPPEAYTMHRILHGVPEGIDDMIPMQAFPMESNLDIMGGLDFRKGCYVGQELTVRTYHTGVVRKRIFPVQLYEGETPPNPIPSPSETIPIIPPSDIRTSALPQPHLKDDGEPARVPRPRGTNKLLTNLNGVGLALLRIEHVEGVENGLLGMEVEHEKKWGVRHWVPDWWPRREESESEETH